MKTKLATIAASVAAVFAGGALAQGQAVNLYSARHYQTDKALYEDFTKQSGIKVNLIEGKEDEIIERIKTEGANSPADIVLTVDMARIWRAEQAGILAPAGSRVLEERIPASLRDPEGKFFGFSARARVIVYDKAKIKPSDVPTYESLADPKFKGQICVRSGGHPYNVSLGASILAANGEEKTEAWAKGVVANLARAPKGGDTDQIKAIAAGECTLGLSNSYYYVRLLKSSKADEKAMTQKVGVIFPNQADRGAHVNVSGGGLVKTAPNKANAVKFLEYLASDSAQQYFANGNNEFPVVSIETNNPELASLGKFKADPVNIRAMGSNAAKTQEIYDKAGWK